MYTGECPELEVSTGRPSAANRGQREPAYQRQLVQGGGSESGGQLEPNGKPGSPNPWAPASPAFLARRAGLDHVHLLILRGACLSPAKSSEKGSSCVGVRQVTPPPPL